MDIRSTIISLTSTGILPTAWAASVWRNTFFFRQMAPISAIGCTTPISLFTVMTDTREVSGLMAASSWPTSTRPLRWTGK
uniref:Uncharacterized protein n=1 Tax=Ixodes ricinus TaxID=34613 RepID=A0A6B0TXU6_IXORI